MDENVARDRCPNSRCPTVARSPTEAIEWPLFQFPSQRRDPFFGNRPPGAFWYAKWSREGKPVVRALGRAWAEPDGEEGWRRKRGKPPEGVLTEAQAAARMLELVKAHHTGSAAP